MAAASAGWRGRGALPCCAITTSSARLSPIRASATHRVVLERSVERGDRRQRRHRVRRLVQAERLDHRAAEDVLAAGHVLEQRRAAPSGRRRARPARAPATGARTPTPRSRAWRSASARAAARDCTRARRRRRRAGDRWRRRSPGSSRRASADRRCRRAAPARGTARSRRRGWSTAVIERRHRLLGGRAAHGRRRRGPRPRSRACRDRRWRRPASSAPPARGAGRQPGPTRRARAPAPRACRARRCGGRLRLRGRRASARRDRQRRRRRGRPAADARRTVTPHGSADLVELERELQIRMRCRAGTRPDRCPCSTRCSRSAGSARRRRACPSRLRYARLSASR